MKNSLFVLTLACVLAVSGLCALAQDTITAGGMAYTVGSSAPPVPVQGAAPLLDTGKLQQMVAPIALYPDALVSQVLIASTYPVQVVEAYQWQQKNNSLTGDAAGNAVKDLGWDPSIQSLVQFPQIVERMFKNLEWTQDLGEAFLAQQKDVMGAIQAMRQKAYAAGNLKSSSQQTVAQQSTTIVIQPADPQVVYVPAYDPTMVYGAWAPTTWYYPQAVYAPWPGWFPGSRALAFGAGVAVGAAWSRAWGCDWHGGNIYVNNNIYHGYYGGGSYHGANGSVSHYGDNAAAYNRRNGEARGYNAAAGMEKSGQDYSHNSATGNYRSTSVSDTSNWQHDGAQRSGQSYSNDSLNKQYGGGGYGGAERGYDEEGGAGRSASEGFEGLHMNGGGGGGGAQQAASDRGWSSRGGGGSVERGGGGASFNRGGGFGGGGGRRR